MDCLMFTRPVGLSVKKLLPSRNVLGVVIKKGFKRGDGQEACFTQIHSKNDTKNCINKYRELQSKLHRDITTHCSEWPLVKTLDMISAGECVEKREPSNPDAGNVNCNSNSSNNACGLVCYFGKGRPLFRCEQWYLGL